jgi:uncharacterized protein (DUF433 family)
MKASGGRQRSLTVINAHLRFRLLVVMLDHEGVATEPLDLIDADPAVVDGQARIRGTRIPVSVILDCLAAGMNEGQIQAEYPSLPLEVTPGLSRSAPSFHKWPLTCSFSIRG